MAFMVEDMGYTGSQLGYHTGALAASFCAAEFCSSVPWGMVSDRFGRKPAVIAGTLGSGIGMFVFGSAKTYPQAVLGRVIAGLLCGNSGVVKSFLTEVTDNSNRGVGFAMMGLAWSIGCIFAALMGGLLSRPADKYPAVFSQSGLFGDYPYLLPCLLCVCWNVVAATWCFFVMVETRVVSSHSASTDTSSGGAGSRSNDSESVSYRANVGKDDMSSSSALDIEVELRRLAFGARLGGANNSKGNYLQLRQDCPPPQSMGSDIGLSVSYGEFVDSEVAENTGDTGAGDYDDKLLMEDRRQDSSLVEDAIASTISTSSSSSRIETEEFEEEEPCLAYCSSLLSCLVEKQCRVIPVGQVSKGDIDVSLQTHPAPAPSPSPVLVVADDKKQGPPHAGHDCNRASGGAYTLVARTRRVLRQRTVLRVTLNYGLVAMASIIQDETLPLFLKHDIDEGGLSFETNHIGLLLSITGGLMLLFTFFVFPRLTSMSKAQMFQIGTSMAAPLALCWPLVALLYHGLLLSGLLRSGSVRFLALWPPLVTLHALSGVAACFYFTAVTIQVNHSVTAGYLGAVNGMGQSFAALARAVGPALGGVLWSLGSTHHFVFLNFIVVAALFTVCLLLNRMLPKSLDFEKTSTSNCIKSVDSS